MPVAISRRTLAPAAFATLSLILAACASHPTKPAADSGAPAPAPAAVLIEPAPPVEVSPAHAKLPSQRRAFSSRKLETIFTELDLPTPTSARTAEGAPGPEYWQQRADYVIAAELNEPDRSISATATITYTNNSPFKLDFLWLHLEQNVFKRDSLGTLSGEPGARFSSRENFEGGVNIQSIKAGDQDLPFHVYDTLARVDLPAPIPAASRPGVGGAGDGGSTFTFQIAWSFKIPDYGIDRMGIENLEQGADFEIAQWFPALAKYDDVHGWNTLPYLGQGEFYTEFGAYDVSLTVPRSHIVAATGVLQNEAEVLTPTQLERLGAARKSDTTVVIRGKDEVADPASRPAGEGPLTWRFKAENVRTFAWTSSAAFIWDACNLGGTQVQSVYPKEALPLWEKSTEMLRFAIDGYNKRWFRYPYPVATNVNGCVGGMEYPMIIFCSDRHGEHGLYGVTTHEIGHNWFPMTVNTDERRHAWMDEGFNSFINIYSGQERFPGERDMEGGRGFAFAMRHPGQPPMEIPPDQLGPGLLGLLEYGKTAVALHLLREVILGPERFDAAFRTYIARWAFKSPRPADFFRTMENVAGMDLGWFWRGWILETGSLDQSVESVEQRSDAQTATATLGNRGELVMPVTLKITYDDGSTETRSLPIEIWHWTNLWTTEWETKGKRVTSVEIDPEGKLPDTDPSNNTWNAPPPEAPPAPPTPATATGRPSRAAAAPPAGPGSPR